MLDASKRRLTLLLIFFAKCFNKQLIIRSHLVYETNTNVEIFSHVQQSIRVQIRLIVNVNLLNVCL